MLGTGIDHEMVTTRSPIDLRTGATFVHDWFAIGVWLAVVGHIVFALRDPDALAAWPRGTRQRPLGTRDRARAGTRRRDRDVHATRTVPTRGAAR